MEFEAKTPDKRKKRQKIMFKKVLFRKFPLIFFLSSIITSDPIQEKLKQNFPKFERSTKKKE